MYIASFYENLSEEPISVASLAIPYGRSIGGCFQRQAVATSQDVSIESLIRIPRRPWLLDVICFGNTTDPLEVGEKRLNGQNCFECPPLLDMDDPFWQTIEGKTTSDGIVVRLTIVDSFQCRLFKPSTKFSTVETTMTQDILIKPRPGEESALLKQWLAKTNEVLPVDEANKNATSSSAPLSERDLSAHSDSDIQIGGKKYNPWVFIRYGNRKPSFPCNPTTLDGWRTLESSLAPSTMRDEVRLTRLQLEYYDAEDGEASENALRDLFDWLRSLPEPQQAVMIRSIIENAAYNKLDDDALIAKRRALDNALSERLGKNSFLQ